VFTHGFSIIGLPCSVLWTIVSLFVVFLLNIVLLSIDLQVLITSLLNVYSNLHYTICTEIQGFRLSPMQL
jgi:hypothetical protein